MEAATTATTCSTDAGQSCDTIAAESSAAGETVTAVMEDVPSAASMECETEAATPIVDTTPSDTPPLPSKPNATAHVNVVEEAPPTPVEMSSQEPTKTSTVAAPVNPVNIDRPGIRVHMPGKLKTPMGARPSVISMGNTAQQHGEIRLMDYDGMPPPLTSSPPEHKEKS